MQALGVGRCGDLSAFKRASHRVALRLEGDGSRALVVSVEGEDAKRLEQIAAERGKGVEEVVADLLAAVRHLRAAHCLGGAASLVDRLTRGREALRGRPEVVRGGDEVTAGLCAVAADLFQPRVPRG